MICPNLDLKKNHCLLPVSLQVFVVSIICPNLDLKKNLDCENFIGHSVNTTGRILINSVFDPMKKSVPIINGPQGHLKVIVLNRPKRFHYFDDIILRILSPVRVNPYAAVGLFGQ